MQGDKKFPPNLHAACQLFCMTNNVENAKRTKKAVDSFLALLEGGPDGISQYKIGRACVCWACGHVGIPLNADKCERGQRVAGRCSACESNEQTNFVRLDKPGDGKGTKPSVVPWMQVEGHASKEAVEAAAKAEES